MMFIQNPVSRRARAMASTLAVALWLAGCASGPSVDLGRPGAPGAPARPAKDGPPDRPPADLTEVPDAVPKVEPIVPSGPNKPYVVEGQAYEPIAADVPFKQRGLASWYGAKFHGRRTASGELYSMYGMTAAHRTLPIPSYARIRSVATGKSVIVRVNDRGPFHSSRVLDLSYTAAAKLDVLGRGTVEVEIERITFDQIRTGQWRNDVAVAQGGVAVPEASAGDAVYALASRLEGAKPQPVSPRPAPDAVPLPPASAATAQSPVRAPVNVSPPASSVVSPGASGPAAAEPGREAAAVVATPEANKVPAPSVRPAQETQGRAYTTVAKGFWVQLAAFGKKEGVDAFQQRVSRELSELASLLAVFHEGAWYRLQIGPYASREEAQSAAQHIRDALQLVPMVVDRR